MRVPSSFCISLFTPLTPGAARTDNSSFSPLPSSTSRCASRIALGTLTAPYLQHSAYQPNNSSLLGTHSHTVIPVPPALHSSFLTGPFCCPFGTEPPEVALRRLPASARAL
ncbi:hypothetical protein R3P38DRAFT_3068694 [Favolaschia claudopus]|uniref:Secreted protein n=1 Tax=Favolaschia claudopus TaxID=2862362 RepID=A0AAW0A0H6_9AGAR